MKTMYVCEDNITGMFSAIYDAWLECRDKEAGIGIKENLEQQLFCEYKEVRESEKKARAVVRFIQKNLGKKTYLSIYQALLSEDPEKADAVFRVIQCARSIEKREAIMDHLSNPAVEKVFSLSRQVGNEAHRYLEFIRFRELESGILFSEIEPKSRVLTCIADHFADRFPRENWVIYDCKHKESVVHRTGYPWIFVCGEELEPEKYSCVSKTEKEFTRLWQGFFESVTIPERENPKCQNNHLPLRYREKMTEFSEQTIQTKNHCIQAKSIV